MLFVGAQGRRWKLHDKEVTHAPHTIFWNFLAD
jgi:hypothetical protein